MYRDRHRHGPDFTDLPGIYQNRQQSDRHYRRQNKKSVDVVSTSEVSVSLTVDNENNIKNIIKELKEIADVEVLNDKAIICVVGEGMSHTPGIAGKTFITLGKNKINVEMISQGASEINITFIIDGKYAEKAVKVLHKEYFE